MLVPVILAGGIGSRLWPLSRECYPKQFLPLLGEYSLLQATLLRSQTFNPHPLVLCNDELRFIVAEQLKAIDMVPDTIILEPSVKNTAPAIAIAALYALSKGQDPLLLVLPADHYIADTKQWEQTISKGQIYGEADHLVTFGIKPTKPETAYGYIKAGDALADGQAFNIEAFTEKPEFLKAQQFLASGEYYWNSGMFLFKASRYIQELENFQPTMVSHCREAMAEAKSDLEFLRIDQAAFEKTPADSIDYALMEKTHTAVMVPMETQWSDIGSFKALWEQQEKDEKGNVLKGDVLAQDIEDVFIQANSRLVTALGVKDLLIVETPDAVLVVNNDQSEKIKDLVTLLKAQNRYEVATHRKVYRPWGSYETVDEGDRFQVKRLTVKPDAKLSLQTHQHRAEHWVIVKGTALVTRGEETSRLYENESTYIPAGTLHRLANDGKIPLEVIEVQTGGYLGEDDIVRVDDQYGRIES